MYEDDKDALASEYVLGTLSAEEREHAEGLLLIDPGFEAAVHQWERRLGELNVMVEAVEPPAEVWEKIKAGIFPFSRPHSAEEKGGEGEGEEEKLPHLEEAVAQGPESAAAPQEREDAEALEEITTSEEAARSEEPEKSEALEVSAKSEESLVTLSELLPAEAAPAPKESETPSTRAEPNAIERSADVVYLARRLQGSRRITLILGALVAALAMYIAVWQIAPGRIPPQLRPAGAGMAARTQPSARLPQDRLVAVLQQEPTAPAFLLTLDTRNRMLIVRNVSATPVAGRSYELWLIAKQFPSPRSLGLVGDGKFTQRALPANYDVATLRTASYAVSLEPAGGSPSGVPTGPVLFTGKAVESLPGSPPPKT